MNCDRAKELLVDLVYGELTDADRSAVLQHLSACQGCRQEEARLRLARSFLAHHRAAEPAEPPAIPAELEARGSARRPATGRLGPRGRKFLATATAAAAALLIGVTVWLFQRSTPPALGESGPVEIKRIGVSLTILSQPENWPGPFRWNRVEQRLAVQPPSRRYSRRSWPGMALVRDQRLIRRLKKGQTEVRFTGVPSGILPDTVRMRSLDSPDGLRILEQNYQYDLASATAVLNRYIDKWISIMPKDGRAASGVLLSFDNRTLVIQPPGQGPRNVSREHVKAISFQELPEGLLTQPTLLWRLDNRGAARQQFEVAYLTHGLNWRADYVLKVKPAGGRDKSETADIFDTADLVGYATVTNNSGVTYEEAQLKLLAGDVNLIRPPFVTRWNYHMDSSRGLKYDGGWPQFQEKSFFEYHLYTLSRPTTIQSDETKQIELVSGSGIRLKRGYVYDRSVNAHSARVVSEFKNTQANGLGKPLPKGVIRLYAPDPQGVQTYVSKTTIDHTPKDEKVRLPWGFAFDIACSHSVRQATHRGPEHYKKHRYTIRNHKDYGISVTVIARVPKTTYKGQCNYPWHVREVGVVEIYVPVKANSQADAMLSIHYNDVSGGGLKSPHDNKD